MTRPWRISQVVAIAAAALMAVTPSKAYYHYVYYLAGAPYTPVPAAFDLTALPNRTVTFFVENTGPANYGPNDTFGSVLSQVKEAMAAWNAVPNCDLRLAFGGLENYNAGANFQTPGGDVIFQDLPPGLLGMGAPTISTVGPSNGQNGPFFPITRGLVILANTTNPNANDGPGPSYLEEFYTTAVHEFGHALGLQHTWTGAAMSQDVIRNTSRARPIDGDDMASLLTLYGSAGWNAATGSISGFVTVNGTGAAWHMASVVAIPTVGPAVSTLTNPDGSYTIDGLVPGAYMLYVHPLPPDAVPPAGSPLYGTGLTLPVGAQGQAVAPSNGYFQTVFYPGTTDVTQAQTFTVTAGQALTGENFAVAPRASTGPYDIGTWAWLDPVNRVYSYAPNGNWIYPAYAGTGQSLLQMYAAVTSAAAPEMPLPAAATLLGVGPASHIGPYCTTAPCPPEDQGYFAIYFQNPGGLAAGPHHLVLAFNTSEGPDLFVLPDAVNLVNNGPPAITSLTPNNDGSVTVAAAGLTPDSRIFFDGLEAMVTVPFVATDANDGTISVMPPQGQSGQNATVTVFTADNQNSMLVQSPNPVTYAYPPASAPTIVALNPPSLPTGYTVDGTAAMVDITTTNTNFVWGQVTVGFGSSDIQVRRVWVLGPTHVVADVVVANNAAVGAAAVSILSGFQALLVPAAFPIVAANTSLPTPALPVYNAVSYATVLHDSDYGTIFGSNLAAANGVQVLLDGQPAPLLYAAANQINFQIPAGFPVGAATLQVNNGSASALPVYIQVDSPPAVLGATPLTNAAGAPVQAVSPGEVVSVEVANVSDPTIVNTPGAVSVTLSGVPMAIQSVTPVSAGTYQIQFAVTQSFAGWAVPLVVSVDQSPSAPVSVTAW